MKKFMMATCLAVLLSGCASKRYVPFAVNTAPEVGTSESMLQKPIPPVQRKGSASLSQHLREEAENLRTRALNSSRQQGIIDVERERQDLQQKALAK